MKPLSNLSTWFSRRRAPAGLVATHTNLGDEQPSPEPLPQEESLKEPAEKLYYTIGVLAEAIGIQSKAVVYYERIGLLPKPARTNGNYRAYSPSDLNRIRFIRRGRDLGFTLDQVRTLLELADHATDDYDDLQTKALEHLTDVNRRIADLNALRRGLNALVNQCKQGKLEDCRIIHALLPR